MAAGSDDVFVDDQICRRPTRSPKRKSLNRTDCYLSQGKLLILVSLVGAPAMFNGSQEGFVN